MTIPDRALAEFLSSSLALFQAWPERHLEAMILMQVLRIAEPTLADALKTGLLYLVTPVSGDSSSRISLAHKTAVLVGTARNEAGKAINLPHTRTKQVTCIEIQNLAVGGTNAIKMTG